MRTRKQFTKRGTTGLIPAETCVEIIEAEMGIPLSLLQGPIDGRYERDLHEKRSIAIAILRRYCGFSQIGVGLEFGRSQQYINNDMETLERQLRVHSKHHRPDLKELFDRISKGCQLRRPKSTIGAVIPNKWDRKKVATARKKQIAKELAEAVKKRDKLLTELYSGVSGIKVIGKGVLENTDILNLDI